LSAARDHHRPGPTSELREDLRSTAGDSATDSRRLRPAARAADCLSTCRSPRPTRLAEVIGKRLLAGPGR
jgi:hypothetical protein